MAKPIDHDMTSAAATGWWGAVKGTLLGGLAAVGLGAAVVGGIGAILGGGVAAVTVLAVLGGILGGSMLGTFGMIAGGAGGLMSGGSKVSAEQAAFAARANSRAHTQEIQANQAAMAGMQQGYQAGFAEGQQYVMTQLQAAHEQMLMQGAGLSKEPGKCAAKVTAGRDAQLGTGAPAVA